MFVNQLTKKNGLKLLRKEMVASNDVEYFQWYREYLKENPFFCRYCKYEIQNSTKRRTKRSKAGTKLITVAQRIERQPHLKKHLDPKGTLKPGSILAKYYRQRKRGQLPAHEENPPLSVFKNVSVDRKNKQHIARFQQDIPKNITFEK